MGKQVNFYMTAADEASFVEFVRSDRSVGIFMYAMPTNDLPLLAELPKPGAPFALSLWLWSRDHSPVPEIVYIPEQRYYVVDSFASEVIEFSRSCTDEGRLVRGRIWAEMSGWRRNDPGTIIKKGQAFSKWFDRLANWIRRRSVRDEYGDYVMPGAAEFARQGGELVQAVFAKSVKYFYHEVKEDD